MAYDRENLYVAFRCHDKEKELIRAHLCQRDYTEDDDRVGIYLDTFNSQRRAYTLASNVLGSQEDGFWVEGKDWDRNLDILYYSEGNLNAEGYAVEFAIPFKGLRFPVKKIHSIGLLAFRVIQRKTEYVH